MRAAVVALGDLGRSARMRYHAQALSAQGVDVDLVGFEDTPLPRAITEDPRITVHRLSSSTLRHGAPSLSYAPVALVDAARISFRLWSTLRRLPRPDLVLVQNPPAFPTLMVTHFTLVRRGVRFVIDWHNIGYTLLRLRIGQWHPAVRFARWLERHDARKADASLCVSRGLADFLKTRFGLSHTYVLYDRPASIFVPVQRV
jgi:beta-1,4-mannosyltransferase